RDRARRAMRAGEELDGSPERQVIMSQRKAATSAAKITAWSTASGATIPFPTVVATATPKPKAATKLKNAAHATAMRGVSTRVETTVAIEFAASWKPFMKSKARATRIKRTIMRVREGRPAEQVYSSATPSITLATSSQRSMAFSR